MRHTDKFSTVLIHSDKGENVIPLDLKKLILLIVGSYSDPKVGWRCGNFTEDSEFHLPGKETCQNLGAHPVSFLLIISGSQVPLFVLETIVSQIGFFIFTIVICPPKKKVAL